MIELAVERFVLSNGLTLLLHVDKHTPLAVVNILYKVGSRNEDANKTGFAHLFEHLMFAGSKHVNDFDKVVQEASGENNAFTNSDVTNYYINLPSENLEIALWLEADRMQYLNISDKSLYVQQKVVVEEFKQRYLNKPYGDVGHLIRDMIYKNHPYRWPTIGLIPEHIEYATLDDVKQFYDCWYSPNNSILSITGNIDIDKTLKLVENYFGKINSSTLPELNLPEEADKTQRTFKEVERVVPISAIYLAFLMPNRTHPLYYAYDMISDILGNGQSSRLYQALVKEKTIFQSINSYISGTKDKGFLMIEGKVHQTYSLKEAEDEIWKVISKVSKELSDYEIQKVKNKLETNFISSFIDLNSRAEALAYYEFLFNDYRTLFAELEKYNKVDKNTITEILNNELIPEKSVVLYYQKADK